MTIPDCESNGDTTPCLKKDTDVAHYDFNANQPIFMAALHSRCGHYIFCAVSSFFFSRLISAVGNWMSPHTSIHGVVLVRIQDAGLQRAARGSRESLQISTGSASWQRYCTALQQWASAKLCGVEQRTPPILGRAAITLGIGPHFQFIKFGR